MSNLRDIYLEEAEDLFKKMEESLLLLEKSPGDSDVLVADVFRSMHTLKGSSGMFGSVKVADFVHHLETIYDKVRSGEALLSKQIIDYTFKSLDLLKKIVLDPELKNTSNKEEYETLKNEVINLLDTVESQEALLIVKDSIESKVTYHIQFKPNENLFLNGTNPLLLIDELSDLGEARVFPRFDERIVDNSFEPKKSYVTWDVFLVKSKGIDPIKDVFIFVEDDSIIDINEIAEYDLLNQDSFIKEISGRSYSDRSIDPEDLKKIVEQLQPEEGNLNDKTEISAEESVEELPTFKNRVSETFKIKKATSTIRVPTVKLDELMNLVSELVTTQASLSLYTDKKEEDDLQTITESIEKLTRQLRDTAFGMTLIQVESLFNRFQRVLRDLSSQLGKEVDFLTEGGDTELDKRVIENVSDPLLHLIRNSLDHGIESKEERVKKGKPENGYIMLRSYYSGTKVFIEIEDDGKGIDPEKIREKAIERGIISKSDVLTREEIYDLIFTPGFSLAKDVTDISGRGVGMDVVRRNIHDLRGDIKVHSEIDRGTVITLGLPITLSVIDGLLIKVSNTDFIVPLMEVERCYKINRNEYVNKFNQLVMVEGEQLPFVDLRRVFNYDLDGDREEEYIVIVQNRGLKIAIAVDKIEGEYQAVLKPVGKYFKEQQFISGATILGDGTMALVLDAYKIIEQKELKYKRAII